MKSIRSWLCAKRLDDGKTIDIICKIYRDIGSLQKGMSTSQRISVADEWITGITARNSKKLHDKISDHQKFQAHKNCAKELEIRSTKLIEESNKKAGNIWRERNSARIQNTARVLRTVYVVAWKHLSFRVHSHLVELQQQNGLDLGNMLFSHQSCSNNIVRFLALKMSERLLQFISNSDHLSPS